MDSKNLRNSLLVDKNGIKFSNPNEAFFTTKKWNEIKSAALKRYSDQYGFTTYLLILTKNGKLIDININLLRKTDSSLFSIEHWKNFYEGIVPEYDELRSLLGKYLVA